MRLLIVSTAVVLLTAAAWATSRKSVSRVDTISSSDPKPRAEGRPPGDGLIVHEWGTFTSFSGSDGVRLEFRPLVDEDLPPFVLDRFLQSGVVNLFSKSQVRVRMRMETPVTYFYTNSERDVNVRVSFPDGLLTEFYPPVARMEPSFKLFERLALKGSSLDWGGIHLIPTDRLRAQVEDPERRRLLESLLPAGLTPSADERYHYGHARETDSALVHVHRPKPDATTTPLAPAGDFFEKFLFYRGVGNFDLPLKLTAAGDGTFELANSGDDPIRSLFLIDADGQAVRFATFEQIAAGDRLKLVQAAEPGTIDALTDAVRDALVAEGLYEKEAIAMVKTWRSSWFGETGTRLLYVVPRPITDALLPLEINPAPEETVRVLVGRMEIMTPEHESRIAALVQRSAAERQAELEMAASTGHEPNYSGPAELTSLGRLAEPALARVRTISKDPAIRAEARLLLQRMTGTAR
ncbi:MAG: hypothetical protein ACM3U2_13470 [Deltaproteobacteria bacterium]